MDEKTYKCHVNRVSEFLCPVGGAMALFRATLDKCVMNLVYMGNCMLKL